ncbi:MAG: spore coat protein CotJB [Eubacteriales bacterium]|jgi:spore coat protein JB|nr:spore coat protein CotJB [Eubacteriales bacterium]
MSEKDRALRRVQMSGFAALETALFLNSHPDDENALNCFNKYKQLNERAVLEYEAKYGPLTHRGQMDNKSWDWVKTAWPWELN